MTPIASLSLSSLLLVNLLQYGPAVANPLIGDRVLPLSNNEFPYVAYIAAPSKIEPSHRIWCTGTVITSRHILTVAHCLTVENIDYSPSSVKILAGSHIRTECKKYKLDSFITYETWKNEQVKVQKYKGKNPSCRKNVREARRDLAIIKLSKSPVDDIIVSAMLSTRSLDDMEGSYANIAGWGILKGVKRPMILHHARVKILSPKTCMRKLHELTRKMFHIPEKLVCTVGDSPVLLGDGDSGSPLIYNNKVVAVSRSVSPEEGFKEAPLVNLHLFIINYRKFLDDSTSPELIQWV